ncbi:MAG: periplasmic heavy metal sensor [Paracoccaceae bacterium]
MNTPPAPPKRRRWLMPLLFVSLAANLMVAGLVAGAFLSPDGPRKSGGDGQRAIRGVLGEPFFQALPQDEKRAMVREITSNRDRFREGREALRERVDAFLATLRAETFDRAEAERLLGEQRQVALRRQNMGETLLLDRLEAMTTEERAGYADALEGRLKGLRRR